MASTYTTGFGIEKIGSGEQSGAWGTTTNHNLDILDRIASYKAVALSGTTHTLTVREASPGSGTENLQDGMYRVIKFTGALGGNNTVTIAPNTSPAYFIIENATTDSGSSGPYSVILTQGSGANVTVQNGKNAIIYCDGAGSGAVVYDALADLQVGTLEVTGAAAIDGALTAAAITATTLTTSGIASIDDTTDTTSGTTGSIHTDGGVGVAKALYVGTTAKIIGVTTHGDDVVSDTDSTDDLGTTSVRWKELFVDAITATDQVTATGFTGTLDGVLGSGTPAAATVTTLNGVTAPTAQYTSAEETKLAGIETAADVTDATNVLAALVGRQAVATGFTGTLDGILGSGTPAAATVTQLTSGGASLNSTGLLQLDGSTTVLGGLTYGVYVQDGAIRAQGAGNTSSNYTLLIRNSDNTNTFYVRDDGRFSTGVDGESPYNLTTGAAANVFVSSNGSLYRSTSSEVYKTNIETIENVWADKVLDLRPIYYKSIATGDIGVTPENWTHYGFSAEQVATIDPRLVSYKTHEYTMGGPEGDEEISTELAEPIADGVQYTKMIPALVNLIKRQRDEIAALTIRVSALEV